MNTRRLRRTSRPAPIFISLAGEFPNVGDGVIRRLSQEWVRGTEELDVYVGDAPESWIVQVGVRPGDRVYRGAASYRKWLWRCLTSRTAPTLVLEPGEVSLARWHFPRQLALLVAVIGLRLRGGSLLLPPRAVTRRGEAAPWAPTVALHRAICRLSQECYWRDQFSCDLIRAGELVPDIAFSTHSSAPSIDERTDLIVSLRGKRPEPPPEWYSTVARFAAESGLRIRTLAQVSGDATRAREVAARLPDAAMHPWNEDHIAQERTAMSAYSRARLVISDRLHVLILASSTGAVPVEMVPGPSPKVRSHFETIGYPDASFDYQGDDGSALAFLRRALGREDELAAALSCARDRLELARRSFSASSSTVSAR